MVYFDQIMHHSEGNDQFAFIYVHHGSCTLRSVDYDFNFGQIYGYLYSPLTFSGKCGNLKFCLNGDILENKL